MTKILDRYASAIYSDNLISRPDTTHSDTDVLGAAGIAGKATLASGRPGAPLAMALTRLFSGDNRAGAQIVEILAQMLWRRAPSDGTKLLRTQSVDIARAVLAWHRDGVCKPCGGHGYHVIPGTLTIGDEQCRRCHGTGKRPFESQFTPALQPTARWLLAEIERESAKAGPAAMAALAPRLDL